MHPCTARGDCAQVADRRKQVQQLALSAIFLQPGEVLEHWERACIPHQQMCTNVRHGQARATAANPCVSHLLARLRLGTAGCWRVPAPAAGRAVTRRLRYCFRQRSAVPASASRRRIAHPGAAHDKDLQLRAALLMSR